MPWDARERRSCTSDYWQIAFLQLQVRKNAQERYAGTLKMRDMNLRHQLATVEIARHENAAPCCRVENARHENARNAIVWNTECCICLSIAEQECMSRQERAPDFTSCIPARQGGCTETARNSTRLPSESGYRGRRRGCRRCNTRSLRKRPYGVWVLVSLWPSHHES